LPETNRNTVEGTRRGWPLLFWLPLIAVALAASLLSGCAAQSSRPSGQEPRQSAEEDQNAGSGGEEEEGPRSELGHPALGDADAPVVMVEYADFQ
jgi:protein-disulfide isomerase